MFLYNNYFKIAFGYNLLWQKTMDDYYNYYSNLYYYYSGCDIQYLQLNNNCFLRLISREKEKVHRHLLLRDKDRSGTKSLELHIDCEARIFKIVRILS